MKTFILQLEPHDDITSARDKMGWAKSSRILVVWPKKGKILTRQLDLVLLKRHAASMGALLAVVVRDPLVRYHAPRLGIPVYSSLTKASDSTWRLPRRFRRSTATNADTFAHEKTSPEAGVAKVPRAELRPPEREARKLNPLARSGIFLAGVMSVLLLAAVVLPGAEIRLIPALRDQEMTIPVRAGAQITKTQLSGHVPVQRLSVVVEGRAAQPNSAVQRFADRPASGTVVFTNLTDQAVEIPVGTTVRNLGTPFQRFEVTSPGTIPAGAGQRLELPVSSLQAGPAGNLPAGSLVGLEGASGTSLSVTNPQPTSGGGERLLPVPSEADRQELQARLERSLQTSALGEMQQNLSEGDVLLPGSIVLVEVLDLEFQPAQGQPADQLSLLLRARFEARYVAHHELESLADMLLNASLPEGFQPRQGTLVVTPLEPPVYQDGAAAWTVLARQQLQAAIPKNRAVQLAAGLAPQAAQGRLADSLELQAAPAIRMLPSWWPRLPYIPLRIKVEVVSPQPPPDEAS